MENVLLPNQSEVEKTFRENHIIFAALFGSRAKGTAHEKSDFDLLVEFDPKFTIPLSRFMVVKESLKKTLKSDVDLITAHGLGRRVFKNEVLKTMRVLYDKGGDLCL